MRLSFTHPARDDLVGIAKHVRNVTGNPAQGASLAGSLRDQCEKLARLGPRMGRSRPDLGEGLRSFPFGNYLIVLTYEAETLVIVRVLHAHRDIAALFGGDDDAAG